MANLMMTIFEEYNVSLFFNFYFDRAELHVGSQFPDWGWNLHHLSWKLRVLTIGPPGTYSHFFFFFFCFEKVT